VKPELPLLLLLLLLAVLLRQLLDAAPSTPPFILAAADCLRPMTLVVVGGDCNVPVPPVDQSHV